MYTAKVRGNLLQSHNCEALIITCMDFRFWESTLAGFAKDKLGLKTFDVITVPGACRGVAEGNERGEYIAWVIGLSRRLHNIRKVVFINHGTCGAYDIDDTRRELNVQGNDLKKTRDKLEREFKDLEVLTFFAKNGFTEIAYLPV